jgi:transcriptional repressor NrdR
LWYSNYQNNVHIFLPGVRMVCPFCENCDTKVVDKRESDATSTRRRRECLACHQRFTTYERVEQVDIAVVKHDGRKQPFSAEKLRAGILLSVKKRPVTMEQVDTIVEQVEQELRAAKRFEVSSDLIGALAMERLKAIDHVAYIRFASVYRDFSDVESFQREVKELLQPPPATTIACDTDVPGRRMSGTGPNFGSTRTSPPAHV